MNSLTLRSVTTLIFVLVALSSCEVYVPSAYAPSPAPRSTSYRNYSYQPSRANQPQNGVNSRTQSKAFQLAANGQTDSAHAAAARGEGTEDDVRRGEKVYHDKQMLGGVLLGIAGMAVIHEMSHSGEEHKCSRCFGRGYVNGDLDQICPGCGGSGVEKD